MAIKHLENIEITVPQLDTTTGELTGESITYNNDNRYVANDLLPNYYNDESAKSVRTKQNFVKNFLKCADDYLAALSNFLLNCNDESIVSKINEIVTKLNNVSDVEIPDLNLSILALKRSMKQMILDAIKDLDTSIKNKCWFDVPTVPYYKEDIWLCSEDVVINEKEYKKGVAYICNNTNLVEMFDDNDWQPMSIFDYEQLINLPTINNKTLKGNVNLLTSEEAENFVYSKTYKLNKDSLDSDISSDTLTYDNNLSSWKLIKGDENNCVTIKVPKNDTYTVTFNIPLTQSSPTNLIAYNVEDNYTTYNVNNGKNTITFKDKDEIKFYVDDTIWIDNIIVTALEFPELLKISQLENDLESLTNVVNSNFDVLNQKIENTINVIHFEDSEVKRVLLSKGVGGTVIPGEITYDEVAQVTSLEDWFNNNEVITKFNELKYFTGLTGIGDDPNDAQYDEYGNRINYTAPFSHCSNLIEISIPDSVRYIGYKAFYESDNLFSVKFSPGSYCSYFDDYCFSKSALFGGEEHTKFNFTFPLCTDHIGEGAFYEASIQNTNIEELDWLNHIGNHAFGSYGGIGLNDPDYDLIIPNRIVYIGDYAFWKCNIKSVTLPDSVTISYHAFECSSLSEVTIGSINIQKTIDDIFNSCKNIKKITIKSQKALEITDKWLKSIPSKYEIILNDTITSINENAFNNYRNLTSVTIPNSVTSIGQGAFYNCSSLTSVTIPNSVTSIGMNAFLYCKSLTSIEIPNSVTSIGQGAFAYSGLISITIPNLVTVISESLFSGCSNLSDVTLSNSVTVIGNSAFNKCYALTSITIPNSVTTIDSYAFRGCPLTNTTIPDTVTEIKNRAFFECTIIKSITFFSTIPLTNIAFLADLQRYTYKIYVPQSALDSYRTAWSSYRHVIFPIYSEKSVVEVEQGSTDTSIKITNLAGTTSEVTIGNSTYATKTELSDYIAIDDAQENETLIVNIQNKKTI